jgi:hypothetical protein
MKLDKADKYFALYIKELGKWRCARCGKQYEKNNQGFHCSHFYGRRNENTRFEPDNCVSLCWGCHKYFDETNREAYRDFKLKQLGEKRFNNLKLQANTYCKKDRKLQAIIWEKAYKKLL